MSWYRRLLRSNSGAGVLHSKHCHACHERCYIQALNTLRKECIKLQVKYSEYLCGRLNANKFRNLQSLDESRLNYSRHRSQNARTSFVLCQGLCQESLKRRNSESVAATRMLLHEVLFSKGIPIAKRRLNTLLSVPT